MELVSVIKIPCGKWELDISKDKEWMKMHLALLKEIEEQSNVTLDIVVKIMFISTQTFMKQRCHLNGIKACHTLES